MNYDVAVIGSGPGGYVAAIRCAQVGLKVALIERYRNLGGTCLNVGCIPSKALLDSSERYYELKGLRRHGIEVQNFSVDFAKMIERKNEIVQKTCDGVAYLMKKNTITVFHGHASFHNRNTLNIVDEGGKTQSLEMRYTIIASGSKPATLPGVLVDKRRIITSTEALSLPKLPKSITLIGGGVVAVELGSIFQRLGTQVRILEYAPSLIPNMDRALGKELQALFSRQGIEVHVNHKVVEARVCGDSVQVLAKDSSDKTHEFHAEYCMLVVGRKAYTEGLCLENAGVKTNASGHVLTNECLETSAAGIYAIGDVSDKGPMLAHKASEEGVFVAEVLIGQKPHLQYHLIPGVVYTSPEIASVGYSEEQLQASDTPYKSGSFPFRASGRARCSDEVDGFVKVLAHKDTDEILGVHMIGARVSDMIACAVTAMEFRAASEDIARISFAHPSFSEAFKEACLAIEKRAIHV